MLRLSLVLVVVFGLLWCVAAIGVIAAPPEPADSSTAVVDTSAPYWGGTVDKVLMPETQRLIIQFAPGTTLGQAVELAERYALKPFSFKDAPRADGGWSIEYNFDPATYGAPLQDAERSLWQSAATTNPAIVDCWTANTCPGYPVWRAKYDPVSDAVAAALAKEPIVAQLANNNRPPSLFFWVKGAITFVRLYLTRYWGIPLVPVTHLTPP